MTDLADFTSQRPLVLAGCGNMGGAMLRGWLAKGLDPGAVIIAEPKAQIVGQQGLSLPPQAVIADISDLDPAVTPRAVVFAVKPQIIPGAIPGYARLATPGVVFLSIIAGKCIDFFESHLGAEASIVRAMPNMPASVGRAISGAFANPRTSPGGKDLCTGLLAAIGEVAWLDREDWLDALTAVSGSGPAYAFYLVECMARAGEQAGLPADLAMRLARAAVSGAGELLHCLDDDAAVLRRRVTSPGGTTEAALEVMMRDDALQNIIGEAIAAATRRSRELSD